MKLVLIDDHDLVLQGLVQKLETIKNFKIVGAFTETKSFIECIKNNDVDIVIMDLMLKDIHGFELIEKVKSISDNIKIIILSGFYEELLHKRALEIGVFAFLRKECSYEELINCIINVNYGNKIIPDFLVDIPKILTEIELEILKLIVNEYTNENIAKELFMSKRTVETHISNIFKKLNVNTRVGLVREALRLNLI